MKTVTSIVLVIWLTFWLALFKHAHALSTPGAITTITSSGQVCDGGKAVDAALNGPYSCTFHNEDVYIADTDNHRIRKVLASGKITTIAGTGSAGFNGDNMLATSANLNEPKSVAVSSLGEIYIADTTNHRVRKVLTNGIIITIAGNGTAGNNGKSLLASEAQLSSPSSVFIMNDVLYLADSGNNRVCMIFTNGTLKEVETTLAIKPVSVAVDSKHNIYVECVHRVCKIEPNGQTSVIAGTGAAGYNGDSKEATTAQIKSPDGLTVDHNGNLYISDTGNNRIRMVDINGTITTLVGTGSAGNSANGVQGSVALIKGPTGSMGFDLNGNIFFADTKNNKIRKHNINTGIVNNFAGITGDFNGLKGREVVIYCGNGIPINSAMINSPFAITSDHLGNIYFGEAGYSIRKLLNDGTVVYVAGIPPKTGYNGENILATEALINFPDPIKTNTIGEIFFGESSNYRLRKILTNGTIITIAGTGTYGYSSDGLLATDSKVSHPQGIAFNSVGDIFFSDKFNHRIAKISAVTGILTTFAGITGSGGYNGDNILATDAKLKEPNGLWMDSNDELYIADNQNKRVRKVFSNGTIITIAGNGISGFSGDGLLATQASFNGPETIAIDPTTNEIFIGDKMNRRIRKIDTNGTITTILGGGTSTEEGALAIDSSMGYAKFCLTPRGDFFITDTGKIRKINSFRTCNGISAGDKEVCNGVGQCTFTDVCSCPSTYVGNFCEYPLCNGVSSNTSTVCGGHGECTAPDVCKCNSNYTGQLCDIPACNGTSWTSSQVCNGAGVCSAPGVCNCDSNHAGQFCEIPACNGTSSLDSQVCNGVGVCSSPGVCSCDSNHAGPFCQYPKCNGTSSLDPLVCNGAGVCSAPGVCNCDSNHAGQFCQYPKCNGTSSSDSQVCNGAGVCSSPGVCNCDSNHAGQFCQYPKCNGTSSNDASVCSGTGSCVSVNKCSCIAGYYGYNCELMDCFGNPSVNSNVCSGNGQCVQPNVCSCKEGYTGDKCELIICHGITSNSSQVCNSHGSCVSPNSCSCRDGFYGANCNVTTCFGEESLNANVCHQHGTCKGLDTCECKDSWYGKECDLINCFGIASNDTQVCSGHGSCVGLDKCTCSSNDWTGVDCSEEVPQIKSSDDIFVSVDRVPFNVKQYLTCSQCNISQTLQNSIISWKQIMGPSVEFSKLASNDLQIVSFSDQTAQAYTFEVSLTYKTIVKKEQVTITTLDPDFTITLYQSNINSSHVTVGVELSPESITSKIVSHPWTFKCKSLDSDCNQEIVNELNHAASNRLSSFTLKAGSSKSIIISLQILNTIRDLPINFPQDESVPIISLVSVLPQKSSVSTSDKLSIQLLVSIAGKFDGIESKIKREWKLNGRDLLRPVVSSPLDASKSNLVVIDVATLPEGSSHNLTCTVTNLESKMSSVFTYTFNVLVNPKACSCNVSPNTGYSLNTQFSIICLGCSLSSQHQLQYSFIDSKTQVTIPLQTTKSTTFNTLLPYTGSSNINVLVSLIDLKTQAKSEQTLNVTILLPKAKTLQEVRKMKSTWETIYKTTLSNDPRKIVLGYMSTTVDALMAVTPLRSLCLNGGVFNSELKMCNCTEGFKKSDCSMSKSDWLELVNDKWITAQLLFEEFNLENQLETPTVSSVSYQSSILYHLLEKADETSDELFNHSIQLFKSLLESTKSNSLKLPPSALNSMQSNLRLMENVQHSIDGKISPSFEKLVLDSLITLGEVSFNDQQIAAPFKFESLSLSFVSQKMFPFELSNAKIGEYLEFPSDLGKYLNSNVNFRKPLNIRVWKREYHTNNQTVQTIDNIEISTTLKSVDYSYELDFGSGGQILNIPQQDQALSYLFAVTPKVKDSQISEPIDGQKTKTITTTSEMICISDLPCLSTKVNDNLYSCKCPQVSFVSIGEKTTTKVQYSSISPQNNDLDYLAFLTFVPVILIVILGIIGVVLYMKLGKKEQTGKNVELKSV